MSDAVVLGLISAVTGVLTACIAGLMAYLLALIKMEGEQATKTLHDIQETGAATHTLVNSNMSTQLKISAVALRRVAELTGHATDIEAARLAEIAYAEQEKKQAVVDAGQKIVPADEQNKEDTT